MYIEKDRIKVWKKVEIILLKFVLTNILLLKQMTGATLNKSIASKNVSNFPIGF